MKKQQLFLVHLQDLNSLFPSAVDCFVCPICFGVFQSAVLDKPDTLTIGHVWPENYFRDKSQKANKQTVLLCQNCNSRGGYTFDAAMQEYEESKALAAIGEPHDTRFVNIYSKNNPRDRSVRMQLFVMQSDNTLSPDQLQKIKAYDGIALNLKSGETISVIGLFPLVDRKGNKQYNVKEWSKAKEIMFTETFTLAIEPYDSNWLKGKSSDIPQLWQAGLLTAAYLYAFYTFGYRYIFQSALDPVRSHIMQAFERKVPRLNFDPAKTMNVATYSEYFEHPHIGFFNPSGANPEVPHLRVNFLEYAIWLPLRYSYILDWDETPDPDATGVTLSGLDHQPHPGEACHWELLFGEPDYSFLNGQVVMQ